MFAVGFGATQFVPLLAVYRRSLHLSDAQATAVYGVYALGLIPGLLLAGPASDRYGRKPLMLAFDGLSLVATGILITGQYGPAGLYLGRLLTGVVSGAVFAVGSAWVKELSEDAPGAGARRAALSMTAGFGVGALIAGVLAQWAPGPLLVPYLAHLLLATAALALVGRAPETVLPGRSAVGLRQRTFVPSANSPAFRRVLIPLGPWVLGSITLAFTTVPAHAAGHVAGLGVVFPGVLAMLALTAGIAVQPLGRRCFARPRGELTAGRIGLALVGLGVLATAAATSRPSPPAAMGAGVLLGAGYGLCILSGLRLAEQIAAPGELGALVALFYCLAYSGLAIPYLLALAAPRIGYPTALSVVAAFALAALALLTVEQHRGDRTP